MYPELNILRLENFSNLMGFSKDNNINPYYDLSQKIKNGDEIAFKLLFDQFCESLVHFSFRYLQDLEAAENIVQDAFLHIWEKKENIDPHLNIKTYLYTIVKNDSFKYIRHLQVRDKYALETSPNLSLVNNPDDKLIEKEFSERFYEAINKLPPKTRQVFEMAKFDNFKYQEIAEVMEISVKTVENQMGRAFRLLRESLKHLISLLIMIISEFL